MRRYLTALLSTVVLSTVASCAAAVPMQRGPFKSVVVDNEAKARWNFRVDSVMTRSDVTRVYATLIGEPNRAGRVDSITIMTEKGVTEGAVDIDGVDFRRWFQWEEEGALPLEIDFPAGTRPGSSWTITIISQLGPLKWQISAPKAVSGKRR